MQNEEEVISRQLFRYQLQERERRERSSR